MVIRRNAAATLALSAAVLLGCSDSTGPDNRTIFTFSFEEDLDGWVAQGTDLTDPPIEWSITHTEEEASVGQGSAKFVLNNMNDAGKIWLERSFELDPDTDYDVAIEFDFATRDYGAVNHWTIIAGAHTEPPTTADDLEYQDDTGTGEDDDVGHVWFEKRYTMQVTTSETGEVVIAIGVWGTWEVERAYYVDAVRIVFTER